MIAYVYFKNNNIISCKIDNIESISDIDKEIKGENNLIRYGDSQDYIILETDSINLNKDDIIILDNLVDERNYFINKELWYQNHINQNKEINKVLQSNMNFLTDTIVELSMNITV